jgi:ferredoxin
MRLYPAEEGARLDIPAVVASAREAGQTIYACGPERLLNALEGLTRDRPDILHVEHFSSAGTALDPAKEVGFDVELTDSKLTVHVPPTQTVLQVLRAVGIDIPSDCEEGLCGSCEVMVVDGAIDHRDKVLSQVEREESRRMMVCCSRARGEKIRLCL